MLYYISRGRIRPRVGIFVCIYLFILEDRTYRQTNRLSHFASNKANIYPIRYVRRHWFASKYFTANRLRAWQDGMGWDGIDNYWPLTSLLFTRPDILWIHFTPLHWGMETLFLFSSFCFQSDTFLEQRHVDVISVAFISLIVRGQLKECLLFDVLL